MPFVKTDRRIEREREREREREVFMSRIIIRREMIFGKIAIDT